MKKISVVVIMLLAVTFSSASASNCEETRRRNVRNSIAAGYSSISPEVFRLVEQIVQRKGITLDPNNLWHVHSGGIGFERRIVANGFWKHGGYISITWDGKIIRETNEKSEIIGRWDQ